MELSRLARHARTAQLARLRLAKTGMTMAGKKVWTAEEKALVRQFAPAYDELVKRLPHRTRKAIRLQASVLRVARPCHIWSAAEISKLRKVYPRGERSEICSLFAHSTWVNIQNVARYHGFYRARRPYKLTGHEPLDQVRAKCFELNLNLVELDAECRTKRYFQSGWCRRKLNYRALGRAIEALDGKIQVQWS